MIILCYNTESLINKSLIDFLDDLETNSSYIIHEDFMYPQKCQFRIDDEDNCPLYTIITDYKDFDVIKCYINTFHKH